MWPDFKVPSLRVSASALGRAIQAATDLVRLTRPAIASGNERRVKTMWDVAVGCRPAHVARELVGDLAGIVGRTRDRDRAIARCCASNTAGALDAEIAPDPLYQPLRSTVARHPRAAHRRTPRAASASLAWRRCRHARGARTIRRSRCDPARARARSVRAAAAIFRRVLPARSGHRAEHAARRPATQPWLPRSSQHALAGAAAITTSSWTACSRTCSRPADDELVVRRD